MADGLGHREQPGGLALQADAADIRLGSRLGEPVGDFLVEGAGEDHLGHFHGRCVGDPEAVDEGGFHARLFQHARNLRSAALDPNLYGALLQARDGAWEMLWQAAPEGSPERAKLEAEMLAAAGLPTAVAAHAHDESHDGYIEQETELAFSRTGRDVGTPIITFRPGRADEGSFFGPVISAIPRGDAATRLWDAIEVIATSSGMSELKRSNRASPDFG